MHAKTNRLNSDFQILHFLVGSCHTPDGAYALLCDLRDDRADALKGCRAAQLREQAKRIRAQRKIESDDEADALDGRADLAEIEASSETVAKNIAAAEEELRFIETCISKLQPFRQFKTLPDPQAHQAAQTEEWKLELIHRAENCLLTYGNIPPDQFVTMRMHPAFHVEIWPAINRIRQLAATEQGRVQLLNKSSENQSLPGLLLGVSNVRTLVTTVK